MGSWGTSAWSHVLLLLDAIPGTNRCHKVCRVLQYQNDLPMSVFCLCCFAPSVFEGFQMPFTGRVIPMSCLERVPSVVLRCCRMNTRSQKILSSKDNHKKVDITLLLCQGWRLGGRVVGKERLDCWKSRFFSLYLSRQWTFIGFRAVADKVVWFMVDLKLILWSSFLLFCRFVKLSCPLYIRGYLEGTSECWGKSTGGTLSDSVV